MIDYATLDSAIGHNWYDLDPDLQARVRRDCPPEDLDWADAKLREFGGLVGGRVAPNSEIVDANPPALVRYDRWADEINEIKTICHSGKKATMTVRVDEAGRAVQQGPQVEIGGNDRYVSVSRAEFKKVMRGESTVEGLPEPQQPPLPGV